MITARNLSTFRRLLLRPPKRPGYLLQSNLDKLNQLKAQLKKYRVLNNQLKLELNETADELLKFRQILHSSPDAILITNQRLRIIYVNPAWEKLTGYRLKEVLNKNPLFLRSGKTPKNLYKKMLKTVKAGRHFTTEEVINKRKNGSSFQIHSTFFPISKAGQLIFFVQIQHDITNRKQTEALKLQLAEIVQSSNDAIIGSSPERIITSWNSGAEKIYGWKEKEVLGQPVSILIPACLQKEDLKISSWLLQGKKVHSFETERCRKDGSLVQISLNISLMKDDRGRVTGFSAIARDISHQKRIEKRLEELAHQTELILESAGDGIYGLNQEGKITFVNEAAAKMLGWDKKELLGKFMHSTLHHSKPDGTKYPQEECPIYAALKDGRVHHVSNEVFWRKDGSSFPVEYTSSPILEKGRVTGAVAVFNNITERRRIEDLKKEFLSVAAHELKTPISTLKLLSETHLNRYKKHRQVKLRLSDLKMLDCELGRLTRLINDLLDDQRLETGKLRLNFEEINLIRLTTIIVKKMKILHREHQIIFNHPESDIPVIADPERIEQVVVNLINNAAKYSPSNTTIAVEIKKLNKKVVLSVSDQGPGIPMKEHKKIFERFHQLQTNSSGFGLGLYIAKEIISRHHGKLMVRSKKGQGSIFSFDLKLA